MSGGGPSPWINESLISCNRLIIESTNLASPVEEVIENIDVGDILEVRAYSNHGPIQVINEEGEVAGSLIVGKQDRLLECLTSGTLYKAEVKEIVGGSCKVKISPR